MYNCKCNKCYKHLRGTIMKKSDFKDVVNMELSSNIPIYEQLANYIRIQIQTGFFKPGEKVIPENDLCDLLSVSRTTVRQAMEKLVDEGLIIRYRRKGSFIADSKLKRSINSLYNFSNNMRELGANPSSIVIKKGIEEATEEASRKLQLPATANKVFYLERLRCADDKPVLLEKTYIPYYLCTGIEFIDFEKASLYDALVQIYALKINKAIETISAVLIREEEAKLLKCEKNVAGYKISRISYLDTGFIYEYTTSITRADMCEFQFELYKNPQKNRESSNIQRNISLK